MADGPGPKHPPPDQPPTHLGLASGGRAQIRTHLLGAWDAFLDIAEAADPAGPTRLPGWTVREVVLHLGRWPDSRPVEAILDSVRDGAAGSLRRTDDLNEALVASHADASWPEILQALHTARAAVADLLDSPELAELGGQPAMSVLGPLPVLTILHAGSYELAVHALDLGVRTSRVLNLAGLAAVADTTGALATRQGMKAEVSVHTPDGGWRMVTDPLGWQIEAVEAGTRPRGVAISGAAADVLDVSAGRAFGPNLLAQRRLKVHDLRGILKLAPIVEAVPGIPGGAPLRAAARVLGATAGLADRLPRLRR